MASDGAFKYYRYTEQQAYWKLRRLCVRERKRQVLNELADVDMPPWKKRRLIREVVYYAGCSDYQPLMPLGVYDYETETERMSDDASYCFSTSSSSASSPAASSSAEGTSTGTTEEVDESTTDSRSSVPVESSPAESVKEPAHKSISLPSLGPSVESSLGQSASGVVQKSTELRASEPMESSLTESDNEPSRKSSNSRTSGQSDSTITESVNESARKSSSSRPSRQSDSTVRQSVNQTARKSTSLPSSELDVESTLMESINGRTRKSTTMRTTGSVSPPVTKSVNEEVDKASTLGTSELVDSSQEEDEFVTIDEWTTSEQNSPEKTRRSEDFNAEILNLSPALSALKVVHETPEESEAGESMDQDFAKNVPFFKHRKLHSRSSNSTLSYSAIYTGSISSDVTSSASESSDHAESSPPTVLLVPSNVQPEMQQLARNFAEEFDCRVVRCDASAGSFDERVSHVMVDLDVPEPMQFAQCQATGCKRYLVSMKWLQDSLDRGRVLPQEPYEVIFCDDEVSASVMAPSRLARLSSKNLFDGFAIVMCRPFVNFNESLMKRLLTMNGARVCVHPRQLTESPDQARLCIIDPKFYRKGQKSELLKLKSAKYKFIAVHYKWLFNSFLMYQVQPILPYLHWAESAEALEAGVPEEFLEY